MAVVPRAPARVACQLEADAPGDVKPARPQPRRQVQRGGTTDVGAWTPPLPCPGEGKAAHKHILTRRLAAVGAAPRAAARRLPGECTPLMRAGRAAARQSHRPAGRCCATARLRPRRRPCVPPGPASPAAWQPPMPQPAVRHGGGCTTASAAADARARAALLGGRGQPGMAGAAAPAAFKERPCTARAGEGGRNAPARALGS